MRTGLLEAEAPEMRGCHFFNIRILSVSMVSEKKLANTRNATFLENGPKIC